MNLSVRKIDKLVVSITSIFSRLGTLEAVMKSIINQDLKPDIITLILSEEPLNIDAGVKWQDVPPALKMMEKSGEIEILFSKNIGPYRKLIPVLERGELSNKIIVTGDDDVLYPRNWLGDLVSNRNSFATVAYRSRAMHVGEGKLSSYRRWRLIEDPKMSFGDVANQHKPLFTLPTGKAGVLYDANEFNDIDLLYQLRELAPMQDDLGFKFYGLLQGQSTLNIGARSGLTDLRLESPSLYDENRHGNDIAIARLYKFIEHRGFEIEKYLNTGAEYGAA